MAKYRVTTKIGDEIEVGDTITDFRGDDWVFRGVERGVEYNGTAKVWASEESTGPSRTFYDRVFGLTVETLEDDA
jgi:hypothetical protein